VNTRELREALHRDAELAGLPPTDLVHRVAGLRRRSRRRWTAVVAGACALVVAVIGVPALEGARGEDRRADAGAAAAGVVDQEAAAREYRELIANAGAAGSRVIDPESLVEYLPNTTYRVRNGALVTLSDAVVVGRVTGVSPGRGFYAPEEDEASTVEVPFDDPRAMWRTIHAQVAVTEVVGGQLSEDTIVVGLGWGTQMPLEVAAQGLPALGDVVLFLETSSPVFDYDPGLLSIAEDGAMLAEVELGGRLMLPAIEPERAERLLAATPTLDSLRAAAQALPRVVPLETLED
jgi:hypothetical protein